MKRNKFSLSHYKLFTCDMGYLVPTTWFDVMPGDSIQMSTSALIRVSPLLAPIMHPVRVRIHNFFIPYRIIWDDFESFITGGEDGDDATVPPYYTLNADWSTYESTLADYFGIPPVDYTGQSIKMSILPYRAYNSIFNNYFRDQDLVSEKAISTASGGDSTTARSLASVMWEKDYFTTARTEEQRGTAVSIPMGLDELPVEGLGMASGGSFSTQSAKTQYDANESMTSQSLYSGNVYLKEDPNHSTYPWAHIDLTGLGIDVSEQRLAFALQRYMERTNKYGARYEDYLRYIGVKPQDGRLQKPEYLSGGTQTIQFSEVLDHTSAGTLGDMAGHGIAAMRSNRFRRFIPEHGIVMSLMSVVPKTIYAQGMHRSWCKTIKEDFYQPEIAHIGDQEITCKEIYVESSDPDDVFGYQARYDEYRSGSMMNGIAGEFRSTLDHWHMARIFASEPSLNSTFVTCTPTKRVLASSSTDALYIMANHSIQARRPVNKRS